MTALAAIAAIACRNDPASPSDTPVDTTVPPSTAETSATAATGDTGDTGVGCVPTVEVPMNDVDDDCDGWADELGADYPRIALIGDVLLRDTHGGLATAYPYAEFLPPSDLGRRMEAGWGGDGQFWVAAMASVGIDTGEVFGVPVGGVAIRVPLESHDPLNDQVTVGAFEGTTASFVYGGRLYEGSGDVPFADFVTAAPTYSVEGSGAVPTARDLDGDGYDELLLRTSPLGNQLYVFTGPVTVPTWGNAIAHIDGGTIDMHSVGRAADFTGDGVNDLLLSSEQDAGYVRVVNGDLSGTVELLDATVATTRGEVDNDDACWSPTAGDANGDGYQDLVVGSFLHDERRGRAYLVLGPLGVDTALADADATVNGDWRYDACGLANDFARDADGDGTDELVVACPRDPTGADVYAPGRVMTYRGGEVSGALGLADAASVYVGEGPYDLAGYQLHARDDVDGDGYDDLVVAAPADTSVDGHTPNGTVYLVSGPLLP